jgi:putative alpha-1,2-mannosidase
MRSRKALAALLAAAVVCLMLNGAPRSPRAEEPAFVTNPVGHVDTLIGTGTVGEEAGEINNFPGAAVSFDMVHRFAA